VHITSPYFIPGVKGVELLKSLHANGVTVSILTNSLATTDVAVVHGAYSKYRKALLEFGITLFELKQKVLRNRISMFGSSTASLHTKTMVVDDVKGFIGSFNLDPRSASINTEMGMFFSYHALAKELQHVFAEQASQRSSYTVTIKNRSIVWLDHSPSGILIHMREPDASFGRRLGAFIAGLLPIESQL
jgi:putative cardiolipin synthase